MSDHFRMLVYNVMRLRSDLSAISVFLEAVDAGSFTAAGIRLGLSKSAVGKRVARLETQLGVRLLDRTTRSLSLTGEGRDYYDRCVDVLAELEDIEHLLASRRRTVTGCLRVSLSIGFGRRWVTPILLEVAKTHPDLDLEIVFSDRRVDLINEGFDLAVRLGEPGDHASLTGRALGAQHAVLCASPDYLDAKGQPLSFEDLADHVCIGFASGARAFLSPLPARLVRGASAVTPRHVVGDGEALRMAVLEGLGIGCLPTWMISDDLRAGRLRTVVEDEPFEAGPITALWPKSRQAMPKIRAAIDALVSGLLPEPPWMA